ncbi:3058_t:CDS:10 [Diversispora eburnea]|uniref:3058_t:CDS:1 n=1 Tax=Diversispora eburnea TaxID=1213867 RepID=A0A9N8V2H5_9GLOM|nr:3058_t:CDS:10 [Diversispora eburnea]
MDNDNDHANLINDFIAVASCDELQAKFYLEANNWNLNEALSNFIEQQETGEQETVASSSSGPNYGTDSFVPPVTVPGSSAPSSRFATLRDLDEEASEEEDDEERENFFAGGEKSAVFTQNPNVKSSTNSLVTDILKKAAEGGRHVEEPEAITAAPRSFFTGAGYKLGSEEEPSIKIENEGSSTSSTEPQTTVVRHLTFWRNGFSIEDGPLMAYNDPANEEFLRAINSGRAPLALLNVKQDRPVDVRVTRRLDEDYKPSPKKPSQPFSGSGKRLGSPTPAVISNTPGAYPSTSSTSSAASASTLRPYEFEVDESLPVTSIQVRLGDGTRMLARFNHTHTVRDIRNFINASRVGEASRNYVLQTTFPSKELSDESLTIFEASLLNAVVVQRYT